MLPSERNPAFYESLKSPTRSRDIQIGMATVPWGWTHDGREGWRLPGGAVVSDKRTATHAAELINREIKRMLR